MPYRRLPNTDTARVRAMQTALETGKEMPPHKLAFSSKNLLRLQKFLPHFENAILMQKQALASHAKKSKGFGETARKARMYVTHFIRVMNLAVLRGELPAETRAFYGLPTNDSTVPPMNTENELLSWGKRVIDGEEFRIRKGASPITNPTIAVVKVRFEQYIDSLNSNNILVKKSQELTEKTNSFRKEADEIILDIWNEVEKTFLNLPDDDNRRTSSERYGLIYFFRKNELKKQLITEEPVAAVTENAAQPGLI
jgi:hypothetical protein